MDTWHKIVFGDCRDMHEIPNKSVHLMVTSPPYYNAPFDYPGLFRNYNEYLDLIKGLAKELRRVLIEGRIACFVTQDVRVKGKLYPICSDIIRIMTDEGFRYRDKIIWKKPEGYIRISRRSGVLIQHPYPMYFYPDNIYEEILIFQKGNFDYSYRKRLDTETLNKSKIDLERFQKEKWYLSVWDITNVLPLKGRLEEGIAAFPEEIPRRLISLFSFVGEVVLDPFLGSGTTSKVAKELDRNSYGYEIDLELKPVILKKLAATIKLAEGKYSTFEGGLIEIIERKDAKRLRSFLQSKIKEQRSVTK
ncbi:TPA: site-specific DNA-methyltransferase [Candidatus Bathyarchaeota archaeon]|nr:site-specific DNA-methyltransferase [Candidatus Bathyarchaeota archaeon]